MTTFKDFQRLLNIADTKIKKFNLHSNEEITKQYNNLIKITES